jgi:hypothetical protein
MLQSGRCDERKNTKTDRRRPEYQQYRQRNGYIGGNDQVSNPARVFKKKSTNPTLEDKGESSTHTTDRNTIDQQSTYGYATSRELERTLSSLGKAGNARMIHEAHNALYYGGVLLMIPALLSQGLLKSKDIYNYDDSYYYSLESVILTLAIMALCRVKNIEQLKNVRSGEIGRLIGMDRIPETKCLRGKVQYLAKQNKAQQWNEQLMELWKDGIAEHTDGEVIMYVDGHVRIYNGYKATLAAKYVSRQKLCLSATSEYWVNDGDSLPYMVVSGELNEKLQQIITQQIIPQLIKVGYIHPVEEPLTHPRTPQCTLVFDREAYDFEFFDKLWDQYRVAIITYRKFVKDKWEHTDFTPYEIVDNVNKTTMDICEKTLTRGAKTYREIRKLGTSGHQTSIITTHPTMKTLYIAQYMFNRWTQENFFKYMIANYNFDQIIEYGTEDIDPELKIVNPTYKKYTHQLKKLREKLSRRKAHLYGFTNSQTELTIDQQKTADAKTALIVSEIQQMEEQENELINLRSEHNYHIKLKDMPPEKKYNKLKTQSRLLLNIIKMICYRAETAVANILNESLSSKTEEKRMLVKQIIQTPADIKPDHQNNILYITIHSMSNQRYNQAVQKLIDVLNESKAIFPGTDLIMVFKSTAL